jgi:hypothetical protein
MSNTRIITCALAVAGVLFIGSQAMAQQGGPSVTVINPATNPAKTSSVDDPGRIPYQFFKLQRCVGSLSCQVTTPQVPQGKRLVVQHVTALGILSPPPGSYLVAGNVFRGEGELISTFTPPPLFAFNHSSSGEDNFVIDQTTLGYADAGSTVTFYTQTTGAFQQVDFTITGYLLDCTVNQCAPIAP